MAGDTEIRAFVRRRAAEIRDLPSEELDRFGRRSEGFVDSSGRSYRVLARAVWDMGEENKWATDMMIWVRTYGPRGWRRWWPYRANEVRPGPPDVPEPPAG
jgi:hypothetical protein